MSAAKNIAYGAGRTSVCWPDGDAATLLLRDIPGDCSCTWVPGGTGADGKTTLMVRKYAHTDCPAGSWHRRRQAAMQS